MKYRVRSYDSLQDCHYCENLTDPKEGFVPMDLMIGPSTADRGITPQDLVGKLINVDHRFPLRSYDSLQDCHYCENLTDPMIPEENKYKKEVEEIRLAYKFALPLIGFICTMAGIFAREIAEWFKSL